jgi:adenylate cyclase
MPPADHRAFQFDKFTLDLRRGCLSDKDGEIELRPKSFEALRYLADRAGQLVAKDEIIRAIWPNVMVTDESLARCISDIRIALRDHDQQIIKTVPRRGYRFSASVTVAGQPESRYFESGFPPTLGKNSRLSIAVLPFQNLSGDMQQEYFADGITEDLTTDLSRIPESFVISRNSAFAYKGKQIDAKNVGRELGVRYLLEGSVRRESGRVRANVQLIDAETGANLWADRFDCEQANLMELQDEVTGRIAGMLHIELIDAESRRSKQAANPDAADLAMRGWSVLHRSHLTEHFAEARGLFDRALELNSNEVSAAVGLAYAHVRPVSLGISGMPNDALTRATDVITAALAANPERAAVHYVRGLIFRNQRRLTQAIDAFETAIALDRNHAGAFASLGDVKTFVGNAEETIRLNKHAILLSPRDSLLGTWQFNIGLAHLLLGSDAEGFEWLMRSRNNNPNFPFVHLALTSAYVFRSDYAAARAALEEALALLPKPASVAQVLGMIPSTEPVFRTQVARLFDAMVEVGLPRN